MAMAQKKLEPRYLGCYAFRGRFLKHPDGKAVTEIIEGVCTTEAGTPNLK
jgi:hypothetical protein